MKETSEELYEARLKRVEDTIQLKVPDRVPFVPIMNFFATTYVGLSGEEALYDIEKWFEANKKVTLDMEPDLFYAAIGGIYPSHPLVRHQCN
jgi:hypothetical protein